MIVAFMGSAGVGKDLSGSLVQYLLWKNKVESGDSSSITMPLSYFTGGSPTNDILSKWKRVKFADKLKDIVCVLTGCTRYQLENQEFKAKELPPEWWKVDKLAIQSWLLDMYSLEEIESDPEIFNKNWKNSPIGIVKYTYRDALQIIGTELFRTHFHYNTWVNATMADYKEDSNYIITDVRFPNEVSAIKERKGIIIKVNRVTDSSININSNHASETALNNYAPDYEINNNGTIEELLEKLKEILIKEKLIQ